MDTKKLTISAILLAIGGILHQLTPAMGLPMQPDFALIMLFIVMLINLKDYKACFVASVVIGIFTALTTKFPGGQVPNIIDKLVTFNVVFLIIIMIDKFAKIKKLSEEKQKAITAAVILPIGTIVSGTIFLLSAQIIVGLPESFSVLFVAIVIPAVAINLIAGLFLYKIVQVSLRRVSRAY